MVANADPETRTPYEKMPTFPRFSLWAGRPIDPFADEPQTVSGLSFALPKPTEIADAVVERLPRCASFNQDPTLAPPGKNDSDRDAYPAATITGKTWPSDRAAYEEKKDQVARSVVALAGPTLPGSLHARWRWWMWQPR